jgi:hypothetical protein
MVASSVLGSSRFFMLTQLRQKNDFKSTQKYFSDFVCQNSRHSVQLKILFIPGLMFRLKNFERFEDT